jgi:OOP family OmpA-OmpF porin
MKVRAIVAALGVTAALTALPAAAQMNMSSTYLGGGIGQSKFQDADDKGTAWKVFGGYRFSPHFAAEAGYTDLGSSSASTPGGNTELGAHAWELSAIGAIPFNALSVYGRLGGYYGKGELSGVASGDKTTTNWTYGAGLQYDFNKAVGVRGEWQRYANLKARDASTGTEGESNIDVLGVSVLYRFQ